MWLFDDLVVPTGLLHAPAGIPRNQQRNVPAVYEDFRPGTYDQAERLADMTTNHVEAAVNFPNIFPRFAGQGFLERADKDLALDLVADLQRLDGRRVVRRRRPRPPRPAHPRAALGPCPRRRRSQPLRDKGSYAIAFTENPAKLGLPSLYCGEWDVLWTACEETATTVSMHIGSSSSMPTTSDDAPLATSMSLYAQNAQGSLCDWVFSGTLARFSRLKLAYAESQVGWMPFQLERMDSVWRDGVGGVELPVAPSEQVKGRVFGCMFDDLTG